MLSDYIRRQQALLNSTNGTLSLSHLSQPLTIDALPSLCKQIRVLSLNHCGLYTLKGIEQFSQLQQLNIKYNEIREIDQIYRIKDKDKLRKLDFSGNDIQYFGSGLFINLKPIFPELIELNGKDFSQIVSKKNMERHNMNKILKRAHQIQKQLVQTVKTHKTKTKDKRYANHETQPPSNHKESITPDRRQTQYRHHDHRYESTEQQEEEGFARYPDQGEQIQNTQKKNSHYQDSECYLKENKNFNNIQREQHMNDISLGGISNIPMTKSVRGSMVSTSGLPQKRKGLEIFTLNQSLQAKNAALSQPTATFAMQRQKQNENPQNFAFKNKSKKYSNYEIALEQYQGAGKYEQERPTKRQTFGSSVGSEDQQQQERFYLQESDEDGNIMAESIMQNNNRLLLMAQRWYEMQLQWKVFKLLKHIPRKRNLPMKLNFQ